MGAESLSDSELWKRVAEHDGRAFGQIFDRHGRAVYNYCFRRVADWSVAEDLTSVVFLEAWRRRRDVRPYDDSLLPWLLGVANNAVRNSERSKRRYRRLLNKLPGIEALESEETDVVRRLDDERQMQRVLDDLRDLRREERDVLSLCDWSGLSIAETATALYIPEGTVKSRLARARAQLRAREEGSSE